MGTDTGIFAELLSVLNRLVVPIVGNYYASTEAQFAYNRLSKGEEVKLQFELNNKFDAYAVKVIKGKCGLGHLDKISAKKVCTIVEDWMIDNSQHDIFNRTDIKMKATITSTKDRVMLQISSIYLET